MPQLPMEPPVTRKESIYAAQRHLCDVLRRFDLKPSIQYTGRCCSRDS